jgi:hypothetical protein
VKGKHTAICQHVDVTKRAIKKKLSYRQKYENSLSQNYDPAKTE